MSSWSKFLLRFICCGTFFIICMALATWLEPFVIKTNDKAVTFFFAMGYTSAITLLIYVIYILLAHKTNLDKGEYIGTRKTLIDINTECKKLINSSISGMEIVLVYEILLRGISSLETSQIEHKNHFRLMNHLDNEFKQAVNEKDSDQIKCVAAKISGELLVLISVLNKELGIPYTKAETWATERMKTAL